MYIPIGFFATGGYGTGVDGVLNVTSGTTNLLLNTVYNYEWINVAAGATISTSSTVGAVLYLLCRGDAVIAGTIDISNKLTVGNRTDTFSGDGQSINAPGVANGGAGGTGEYMSGSGRQAGTGGSQGSGFGGGGGGGGTQNNGNTYDTNAQNGATGGYPAGLGGYTVLIPSSPSDYNVYVSPGNSAGGCGASNNAYNTYSCSATGGNAYGGNGQGAYTYYTYAGDHKLQSGTGGAGGSAGKPGAHVYLKAASITFTGSIITSGTNGTNGGIGGNYYTQRSPDATAYAGGGGGGGGGGNGGNIKLYYKRTISDSGTKTMSAGSYGSGGAAGTKSNDSGDSYVAPSAGSNGTAGSVGSFTSTKEY